jgi:hypothetical protein
MIRYATDGLGNGAGSQLGGADKSGAVSSVFSGKMTSDDDVSSVPWDFLSLGGFVISFSG